jgi:hypothetical protein
MAAHGTGKVTTIALNHPIKVTTRICNWHVKSFYQLACVQQEAKEERDTAQL